MARSYPVKNYGATHFVIGRDHAGPGKNKNGDNFYGDYDAQNLVRSFESELRIKILTYNHMVYVEDRGEYFEIDKVPKAALLRASLEPSSVAASKRESTSPLVLLPQRREGAQALLSSSPQARIHHFLHWFLWIRKSTIASALSVAFLRMVADLSTTLDGDEFRRHLSSNLGYSKDDRNTSIKRVAYVASHITRSRAIAIVCASPPTKSLALMPRELLRLPEVGLFWSTSPPPSKCARPETPRGLYKKARSGELKGLTGIDDPYEAPANADIVIDAARCLFANLSTKLFFTLNRRGT